MKCSVRRARTFSIHGDRAVFGEGAIYRARTIEGECSRHSEIVSAGTDGGIIRIFIAIGIHAEHVIDFLVVARLGNEGHRTTRTRLRGRPLGISNLWSCAIP